MQAEAADARPMLDPRVVFAFVVYLSSAAIVLRAAPRLVPVFIVALVGAACMRVGFKQLFFKLRRLWYVIIAVALLQGIFNPSGTVWLRIGPVTLLTSGGVLVGCAVLMRLAILIIGGSMLSRYANRVLIQGLIQLHAPYEFAYMVSIGLRFIPLTMQVFRDSLTAIQLRGIDFDTLPFSKRMKVYTYLLLPTIASALNSAQELAMAMELRGFRAFDKRTSFLRLRCTARDWLFLALVLVLAAATLVLNLLF